MSEPHTTRPPLSVVIGTRQGWKFVRPTLEAIRPDAETAGAEIVVADGSGTAPPDSAEVGPSVRWLRFDEPSVFRLFAEGLRDARGEIVATTEDHAIPRPGWIEAILRAHAEHHEAAAIGGPIENGSAASLLDWASYFSTQGPHMAPLGDREVPVTSNEANISYKRRALEGFDDNEGLGFMAILHNRRLAERGEILRVDDRMVVDHFQEVRFGPTSAIHYHNGRSISGFRRQTGMRPEEWVRLGTSMLLPAWRTARIVRSLWGKDRMRGRLLASAPMCLWLEYCQGVGNLVGYVTGPGDSPDHLR